VGFSEVHRSNSGNSMAAEAGGWYSEVLWKLSERESACVAFVEYEHFVVFFCQSYFWHCVAAYTF
jgi:hypothetical protein